MEIVKLMKHLISNISEVALFGGLRTSISTIIKRIKNHP
jgi:hypothetical protein